MHRFAWILAGLALPGLWAAQARDLEINTFGDSITQGLQRTASGVVVANPNPGNGAANQGGFQPEMVRLLDERDVSAQVYNWGVGGERSSAGVGRIASVLDRQPADYITINEGANDLYAGISSSTTRANLASMVAQSKAHGVKPILGLITPNTSNSGFDAAINNDYNPKIASLAKQAGVPLAEHYGALRPKWESAPLHSGDRLHLNTEGYNIMAATWIDTVFPGTGRFLDIPDDHFAVDAVETLYDAGITGGCRANPPLFCYQDDVTRAQMAVFIGRAEHGAAFAPPAPTGRYDDVPVTFWAAGWIEQFEEDGFTAGCGPNVYCPDRSTTRAEMAVFLTRAKHGVDYTPPPATGVFSDVRPNDPFARWIEQLERDGITGGCGNGRYCPADTVTRAQMAVFLVRTFNS